MSNRSHCSFCLRRLQKTTEKRKKKNFTTLFLEIYLLPSFQQNKRNTPEFQVGQICARIWVMPWTDLWQWFIKGYQCKTFCKTSDFHLEHAITEVWEKKQAWSSAFLLFNLNSHLSLFHRVTHHLPVSPLRLNNFYPRVSSWRSRMFSEFLTLLAVTQCHLVEAVVCCQKIYISKWMFLFTNVLVQSVTW